MSALRSRSLMGLALAFAVAVLAAACSPTLDWREVRPEGAGLLLLMPCRPSTQVRSVQLAGRRVKMALAACSAGALTWAVGFADVGDAAQVSVALDELRLAAAGNLSAGAPEPLPLTIPGATPNPSSARVALGGRLPDGIAVQEQVAVFARGTRVFQATVLGENLAAEDAQTFFGSLRAGS